MTASAIDPVNSKAFVIGALDLFVFNVSATYNADGYTLTLPKGYVPVAHFACLNQAPTATCCEATTTMDATTLVVTAKCYTSATTPAETSTGSAAFTAVVIAKKG